MASVAVYQKTKTIKIIMKIQALFTDNSFWKHLWKRQPSPHVRMCGYHVTFWCLIPQLCSYYTYTVCRCKTVYRPSLQPTFSHPHSGKHIYTLNTQHQEQSGLNIWLKYILTCGPQRPGPTDLLIQSEEGPLNHLSHGNLEGQQ